MRAGFIKLAGIDILDILTGIDQLIWGPPLLVLLAGTGIFLSFQVRMIQIFGLSLTHVCA